MKNHQMSGPITDDIGLTCMFPVPLFRIKVDVEPLSALRDDIVELCKTKPSSVNPSSWFTDDDLHEHEPFQSWFADCMHDKIGIILDEMRVVRDSHYLTSAWGNITWGEFYHPTHMHPNSFLSGIAYLRAPEKSGPTVFEDPKVVARIVEPELSERTYLNSPNFIRNPIVGDVLIFPSYLKHAVMPGNAGNEARITLAFNYHIRGKTERLTQPYKWA